jgi:nicotinamide-nucleotide amidase
MNAAIVAIGDELVLGQVVDTNSAWLSARLAARGVMTLLHKTVPDDVDATAGAVREAAQAADLVIVTGGLGPTQDDLTREALARVLGVPLERHAPSVERIAAFFRRIGRAMPDANQAQAMCPRGARMLDNDWGTAPGIEARVGRARVFAVPGVPREMEGMFGRYILPAIADPSGRSILTEALRTFGAGESAVAEKLGELMRRDRRPTVGTTASAGVVTVRIRSDFPTAAEAERELAATVQEAERRLGDVVFGRGDVTLAQAVGEQLRRRGKTLVTAESCTGGLVGKLLTDVPGSSAYYLGGWVVYANRAKSSELGVAAELIERHGAVSDAVARAMAEGALARSGADYGAALTGIAGPDGGTADKPVGTVWVALARSGQSAAVVKSERFRFPGTREVVRERAALTALNILRLDLLRA